MTQPIVGNYYNFTAMGIDQYLGKCIGITYADSERMHVVNHRTIIAFFNPNDNESHNICDYAIADLTYVGDDKFANLTRVEYRQIASSTGGNSSSSPVVVTSPLTGGRRSKSKKSKKARKGKKKAAQSRRRV
jgi:hypothetical protein